MENLFDKSFDLQFQKNDGMTWLPWVGNNYMKTEEDCRLLVVGETHYVNGDPEKFESVKKEIMSDKGFTRDVVLECPIDEDWYNSTFANFNRAIFNSNDFDASKFWNMVGFYNFIQRPMNYTLKVKERPFGIEFYNSWKIFTEIAQILKPKYCIFIGVEAANSFDEAMSNLGVKYTNVKCQDWISNAYGRTAELFINDWKVRLVFIRHSGMMFPWEEWNKFLVKNMPEFFQYFYKLLK